MSLDPWAYAAKTRNEYAEQVALFMWANMACKFGLYAASDPRAYNMPGVAQAYIDPGKDCRLIPQLYWLYAIKNAGHGDAVRGAMSKAEGVKPGVPDMFLPVPMRYFSTDYNGRPVGFCGLYIELKRLKSQRGAAGTTSEVQDNWRGFLSGVGYKVEVCHGWEEARDAILRYLGLTT